MSTATLRPNGAGYYTQLTPYPFGSTNYQNVDEASSDGDSTYNYCSAGLDNKRDSYALEDWAPGLVTISSVTVYIVAKRAGTIYTVKPFLRLNSTDNDGTAISPASSYTEYSQQISRPGGGNWTVTDINNLEPGLFVPDDGTPGKTDYIRNTQVWVVVDFSVGSYPAPTNPECERQTTPTNAGQTPIFSAVFNGDSETDTATHAYIEVAEDSGFATLVWDSGWLDIADVDDGDRCAEISYDGSNLSSDPPAGVYYWRIKFKDAAKESVWSSSSQFSGIVRPWADNSFAFRRKLLFDSNHPALAADKDVSFFFKTGNRRNIATNGCFNEAVQASGGFQCEYYNGKWHFVYLGTYGENQQLTIWIQSYNTITDEWGTPYKIADAGHIYDTHYLPVFTIAQTGAYAGRLHVWYGCHESSIKYARSVNPNESGCFPGEAGWVTSSSFFAGDCSYPIGMHVQSADRLYVFFRYSSTKSYGFAYSDDGGVSWSSYDPELGFTPQLYLHNAGISGYRTYQYGFRYDQRNDRLHIAWSYTDQAPSEMTMGVWYAYSDFEPGEDVGFQHWYDIEDTLCGTTNTNPINRTDLDAIIETDEENQYFAQHLFLNKQKQPIICITLAHRDAGAYDPHAVIVARYDSGWQLAPVTDQTGRLTIVGRCGLPGMADRDGTLHAYLTEAGKTRKYQLPDANGYYTTADQYPATGSLYDKVDDGAILCNGDDDYLYKSGGGIWKVSFTSSATLPENAQVLGVGVLVAARNITGSGAIRSFLRSGSTDYNAPSATDPGSTTRYKEISYFWETNPAGGAWTKSAAEAVEFGVEQTNASADCRCSKIVKFALVLTATDAEFFSGEVVELLSDDGATWTSRQLTENSGIGIPIISVAHYLTNNQIALMWTSGHDLFFWQNDPFGLVLPSGRDLMLVQQNASGNTELDRVIDYPNLDESKISFKLPEAIGAGKQAGSSDLYLYAGNAGATSRVPQSNPDDVYLIFDNFESLVANSSLNGQRGWTVNGGTVTIYGALPSHTNKVYAGLKSVHFDGAGEIEKTIGSGVQNVFVQIGLWLDGYGTRLFAQLNDASDNIFAAGINDDTNKVSYATGTDGSLSWTDVDAPRVDYGNYWLFELQVTASGCSAWCNGELFADEISAITSVDLLKIITYSPAYCDFVRVSYRLTKRLSRTDSGGSLTDASMSYNTNHTATYSGTYDGKHEAGIANVYQVDIKLRAKQIVSVFDKYVDLQVWLSRGATYDSGDIEDNDTVRIDLVDDTWVSETISFTGLDLAIASIKADYYASNLANPSTEVLVEIEEVKTYYRELEPTIDLQPEEWQGWRSDATLLGGGWDQWTSDATLGGYLLRARATTPVEHRATITVKSPAYIESLAHAICIARQHVEWLTKHQSEQLLPIAFQQTMEMLASFPLESLANVLIETDFQIETARALHAAFALQLEYLGGLVTAGLLPAEFLGGFEAATKQPVEYRGSLGAAAQLPIEFGKIQAGRWLQQIDFLRKLATSGKFPAAWLGTLQEAARHLIEYRGSAQTEGHLPVSALKAIRSVWRLQLEHLQKLITAGKLPVDFMASIPSLTQQFPLEVLEQKRLRGLTRIEWREEVSTHLRQQLEYLQQFSSSGHLSVESAATLLQTTRLPVEYLGTTYLHAQMRLPVDFQGSVAIPAVQLIEHGATREIRTCHLPIEFNMQMALDSRALTEWLATSDYAQHFAIEALRTISAATRSVIGFLEQRISGQRSPVSWQMTMALLARLPIEFQGQQLVRSLGHLPIDWQAAIAADTTLRIERLSTNVLAATLPVDYSQERLLSTSFPIESSASLSETIARLTIEWTRGVSHKVGLPIDYGKLTALQVRQMIEHLRKVAAETELPLEWSGEQRISSFGHLPICWQATLLATGKLPVESLKTFTPWQGRVLVESVKQFAGVTAHLPTEFTTALRVARRMFCEWIGTTGLTGTFWIETTRAATPVRIRSSIEYNKQIIVESALPIEELATLIARYQLPVEYAGVLLAALCILNAWIKLPGLLGAAVSLPQLTAALVRNAGLHDADMSVMALAEAAMKISELSNATIRGGRKCEN